MTNSPTVMSEHKTFAALDKWKYLERRREGAGVRSKINIETEQQ